MERIASLGCLLSTLLFAASAVAQDAAGSDNAPVTADDKTTPQDAAKSKSEATVTDKGADKVSDKVADDTSDDQVSSSGGEDKDNVRFRGGFVVPAVGPAFAGDASGFVIAPVGFNLGVQINHYLGIVYQGTPLVTFLATTGDVAGGFMFNSSVLAALSVGKGVYFDVAAGPSLDLYALGSVGVGGVGADVSAAPGIASRLALGFGGGPSDDSARRAAFKITVDPHFTFLPGAVLITIPVGIGVEWF